MIRADGNGLSLSQRPRPSSVDGVVGYDEIAQLFSDKYNHIYNSVSYDVDEINGIGAEINRHITEHGVYNI